MTTKKTPKKRNALGRGLGALLEDSTTVAASVPEEKPAASEAPLNTISEIPVAEIETNPFQPRTEFDQEALRELSESIKIQGIIQPITVRRLGRNQYQLISGERRLQASKLAELLTIPAYIRTADDQQMLEMVLIENIQREDLNAMEIALSYQRLISECQLKQEELGDRVGKKRTTVNNYLRLLKLPPEIQAALRDQKISMGHARAIINLESVDLQITVLNKILDEDLSVRKVEQLVRELTQPRKAAPQKPAPNPEQEYEIKKLQTNLSSTFGTKVSIKSDEQNRGEIKIPFFSADDLNRILEIIGN